MTCRCWECRKRSLATVAPRLVAAFRAHRELAPARQAAAREVLHKERLVAHRDLQLARAGNLRKPGARRYLRERQRKLEQAHRELGAAKRRLEELA